ncbi:hypothetical protein PRIPAC_86589, partial [Pristionchus pacificus]
VAILAERYNSNSFKAISYLSLLDSMLRRLSSMASLAQCRAHSTPSGSSSGQGGSAGSKKGQMAPASPEVVAKKTPKGKLDNPELYTEDGWPKRRIVNEETGEIGGPQGPEPTRYGDWERKGRVSDF